MKIGGVVAVVTVVLVLLSCSMGAAGKRFRDLPEPERDAMDRCAPAIRRFGACAPQLDRIGVQQDACMDQLAEQYASRRDAEARRDFLVDAGCSADTLAGLFPR